MEITTFKVEIRNNSENGGKKYLTPFKKYLALFAAALFAAVF